MITHEITERMQARWDKMVDDLRDAFPEIKTIEHGKFAEPTIAPFIWVHLLPASNQKSEASANMNNSIPVRCIIFCGVKKSSPEYQSVLDSLNFALNCIDALQAKRLTMVFESASRIEFDGVYANAIVSNTEFITYI